MYPTRDSLVWILVFFGAVVGYLVTAKTPPTEWTYNEWLQASMFLLATLTAKLQGSPLQLSYKGQRQVAQGVNPFYELPGESTDPVAPSPTSPNPTPLNK